MLAFRILRADLGLDQLSLSLPALLIGSAPNNDLVIDDPLIAQSHAGICWHDNAYWLSNFSSVDTFSGTLLNGTAVSHAQILSGDIIQLGRHLLIVALQPQALQLEIKTQMPVVVAAPSTAQRQALTSELADGLEKFWLPLGTAIGVDESSTDDWKTKVSREADAKQPTARRWRAIGFRVVLVALALVALTALIYPRAFAPGALSSAHQRNAGRPLAAHVAKPMDSACINCHRLNRPMQSNCTTCHTTTTFQPVVAAKHEKLNLQCVACHNEHRGPAVKLTAVPSATCLACHQSSSSKNLHGKPVQYPVNRFGVWSWDGLSQATWSQHELPRVTSDFTLREQFHMLHGEGRAQGRTRCTDCHLGGTEGATLKQNVRESCVQCHTTAPALVNELTAQAKRAPLKQGTTLCVACHAQHGSERDALASVRKE